jgi:hypothetical protein
VCTAYYRIEQIVHNTCLYTPTQLCGFFFRTMSQLCVFFLNNVSALCFGFSCLHTAFIIHAVNHGPLQVYFLPGGSLLFSPG